MDEIDSFDTSPNALNKFRKRNNKNWPLYFR